MASSPRFRALVHYIIEQCDDPKKLGATKLNKALWFADTFAYRLTGKTISGETAYVKRQFGPVPKKVLDALRQLADEDKIVIRETSYFGKPKREFISLEMPSANRFDEDERDIIDSVVAVVCDGHTAASISDLSHDIVWDAADPGEDIPIYAVLAAQVGAATRDDQRWADSIIKARHKERAAA